MHQIMIDITPYIASVPPEKLQEGGNPQYPAALLFLLNHFAKAIMSQLAQEVSRDTLAADPIGILTVSMFSLPEFQYNGHSLIDVLWAKYHKVCPVLFGITGTEKSAAGRAQLGWRIDGGSEVSPQEHYDHMAGFAAGFGAITLRDFSKSRNKSPAPVHLFWTSLARIVISFYGLAAVAALRTACIGFPSGGGPQSQSGTGSDSTVLAVQALPHSWKKDLNLTL
jgi:nucleoporin GLE1